MTKPVSERYAQERLDDDRARRIAEILARGLLTRLKAHRRSGQRRIREEAAQADAYLPETPSVTASDDEDDVP